MADLERDVSGFMIQPLNLGGREDADKVGYAAVLEEWTSMKRRLSFKGVFISKKMIFGLIISHLHRISVSRARVKQDLTMLHPYPEISNSVALTEDESGPLYFGGAFKEAQALVSKFP